MNDKFIRDIPSFIIVFLFILLAVRYRSCEADPESKRKNDLKGLARKLGLEFAPNSDIKLAQKFSFLAWLRRGEILYAYNVIHGYHQSFPISVFDFRYSQNNCYWSAYIMETATNFPDTIITRESKTTHLLEKMGESHITFESKEFSRAFNVRSADKKFAYDICHPKMMEYLLANRDLIIEIDRGAILLLFEDWLRPEKVEINLSRLVEIRKLLPEYLFKKT